MNNRYAVLALALAVTAASAWAAAQQPTPGTVGGCPTEPLAFHLCALDKAKTFNPPRTPSGKPNLQGHYRARLAQSYSFEGVSGSEPQFGAKIMPWSLSPPMIVDPPDRKIPYQPCAASIGRVGENYYKYLDPRTGCAQAGVPRGVQQDPNQIQQPRTDDYILWLFEDHHMQRVINMNQRPPLGASIKLYNGYFRGN